MEEATALHRSTALAVPLLSHAAPKSVVCPQLSRAFPLIPGYSKPHLVERMLL
jgi:hypothetical protein